MSTPLASSARGAVWAPDSALEGAAAARLAESSACKAALTDLEVVRVAGADARAFLHSQFTADIAALGTGQGVMTAWCSAQGRVLFLLRVCAAPDHFDLLLPRALVPKFIARLRMFVLRAAVTITEQDALVMGLAGPPGAGLSPTDADLHGVTVQRIPAARMRFLVFGAREALVRYWETRPEPAVSPAAWTLLDIEDGIPPFDPALSDQILPQQLNLDADGGLSFTKGCYPGQEVIARLKYRGQVKSRLMRGTLGAGAPIAPGTKLYTPGDASGNTLGTVIASAPDGEGGRALLAVVEFARVAEAPAAIGSAAGEQLGFSRVPGWPA